jgi:AraC-like DNA-binding protein
MDKFNIKKITTYIRNNISNELTVEQAAEHFNYSFSHFSREFKKATGFSAAEFISALKIEYSIRVLGKNSTILKAQLNSGYLSSGTFSNFFNRFTGLSPKQYQKNINHLFEGLKTHEQKEEEGAINYPPIPFKKFSENKCFVHVKSPEDFKGIIFVGLFDKPLSNRLPVRGRALTKSRTCAFDDDVPPGDYYLLVCAIERQVNPLKYFVLDDCLRDVRHEPVVFPLKNTLECTLTLRKIVPEDPPITINLPKLLKEGLEKRFFRKNSKVR